MVSLTKTKEYRDFFSSIKEKIQRAQIKAAIKDLKKEFPDMKGFSPTNIKTMRNWYLFYNRQGNQPVKITSKAENRPQLVDGINFRKDCAWVS